MKTALLALSLILGASTVNASTLIASCYGSYEEGRIGETVTVSRDGNRLVVEGPYLKPVSFALNSDTVKKDSSEEFKVVNTKKTLFFKPKKKSVEINFTTGNGQLYVYDALESAVKAKVIYLSHCTR